MNLSLLVQDWRAMGKANEWNAKNHPQVAEAYDDCADELEAALAQQAQPRCERTDEHRDHPLNDLPLYEPADAPGRLVRRWCPGVAAPQPEPEGALADECAVKATTGYDSMSPTYKLLMRAAAALRAVSPGFDAWWDQPNEEAFPSVSSFAIEENFGDEDVTKRAFSDCWNAALRAVSQPTREQIEALKRPTDYREPKFASYNIKGQHWNEAIDAVLALFGKSEAKP